MDNTDSDGKRDIQARRRWWPWIIGLIFFAVTYSIYKDREARDKGFNSFSELRRAQQLGFASQAQLEEYDKKKRIAADELKRLEDKRKAEKEAACPRELQCWGEKYVIQASVRCRPFVERLAKYQFEWTDGWVGIKFSHFRWKDSKNGIVTFMGDKIKFQNGFGAWQFHTYSCDYDPVRETVLNVSAYPGRLPP